MKTSLFLAFVMIFNSQVIANTETAADVESLSQQEMMEAMQFYECAFDASDREFLIDFIQKLPEEKQARLAETLVILEDEGSDVNISMVMPLMHLEDSLAIKSRLAEHQDPMLRLFVNFRLARTGDTKAAERIHELIHSKKLSLLHKQVVKTYCLLYGIHAELDSPQQIAEHLSSLANQDSHLKPGDVAPDFQVTDIDGNELSLAALDSKVVLLHFWATWCGPCMGQMDSLKEQLADYSREEVAIVLVSLDYDQQAFDDAVKELELPGQHVLSEAGVGGELAKAYAVRHIPFDVVIDSNKKVKSNDIRDIAELIQQQTIRK